MNRESRIKILKKLAADKKPFEQLRGKKSKKEVQRAYLLAKKMYDSVASELKRVKDQLSQLQSFVDENENRERSARNTMQQCSDILRNMDFACANSVRINKEDIAYNIDGKWKSYNDQTYCVEPYNKRPDNQDIQDAIDVIPEETSYEGVEIKV